MSYQVIARKWRPQTFEDLVGQPHVSRALLNAISAERLPHALLFTGARGVGKTSSARILAKSLRCPNVKNFIPCNVCQECQDIAHGSSLNVMEIDGASNNGVDAIRELRETVGFMPSSGKYKIYIIDEVHMLSTSAFNALLKTLEEPPPHVIFIFATTEPQKIPITILSRCQRFDFRKIPTRQIADRLIAICKAENVKFTQEAIWLIARQAEGSMRDSQSLLDQAITFTNADLDEERIIDILGLTDRGLIRTTLESLVSRDPQQAMMVVEKLLTTGFDSRVYMNELLEEIRHLLLIKLNPAQLSQVVDLPDSEIAWLKALALQLTSEDIHLLFDMALKGAGDLVRAQTPRVVLEMVLLRMVEAPRVVEIEALLRSESGVANPGGGSKTVPTAKPLVVKPANAHSAVVNPATAHSAAAKPATANPAIAKAASAAVGISDPSVPAAPTATVLAGQPTGLNIPNFALNLKTKNATALDATNGASPAIPTAVLQQAAHETIPDSTKSSETPDTHSNTHTDLRSDAEPTEPAPHFDAKLSEQENWGRLVEHARGNFALLGAKLEHVAPLSFGNTLLRLGIKPAQEFLIPQLKEPRTLVTLQEIVHAFFGKAMEIQFELVKKNAPESLSPKAFEEKKLAERSQQIQTEVENHPLVKKAKELFETNIIDIKENRS